MKKVAIALAILLSVFVTALAQDITLRDTLWLRKATHVDYDLVSWDTVFVDIMYGSFQIERVFLSSNGKGRWNGQYVPSFSGNFVAEYNAVYTGGDTTLEEQYFSVLDTVAFHGAAAGLTKEEIAVTVRDTASNRPDIWTDQASGTGADTFNIYVFDGDTTAVEGVSITIYNKGHTAVAAPSLITDVNGLATTFQDADTFHLYLQRLGVIYAQWDTIVVSNQGIDTIWVTAYDIGSPPSANVTRVKGFTRTYGYQKTDRVIVSFSTHDRNLIDTTAGVFIDKIDEITYSDTGFFQIDLIPSINLLSKQAGITKDSILYDLKMYAPGRSVFEWQNIFVPDSSGSVWLKDILD